MAKTNENSQNYKEDLVKSVYEDFELIGEIWRNLLHFLPPVCYNTVLYYDILIISIINPLA